MITAPIQQRQMIAVPLPQRPTIGNRFSHPGPMAVSGRFPPPNRPPYDRFPLNNLECDVTGPEFQQSLKYTDNPSMRLNNVRNIDARNPGPRLDNPSKFQEARQRTTLFDVPRPRRPLDPHIDIDRPERMPAPFEPVVLQFRPDSQQQRPPFESDMNRPPFDVSLQRPLFEGDMQRPLFEAGMQRPLFEAGMQRPPFGPDMQRPQFEPGMQRPSFDSNIQCPQFPHETPRPLLKPENLANSRLRDRRSPPSRDQPRSLLDGIYEDFSFSEEFERRDRDRERPDYDRPDPEYSRNSRRTYHPKDRPKSGKYGRHNSYEGRRSPPRSSDFRYRHDRNDEDKDRYNREDGPSKAKQQKRTKVNKYSALSTPSALEELEEGEVL